MIKNDLYCVDIPNQLLSTQALLKNVNRQIIEAHIQIYIRKAFQTEEINPKLKEVF